MDTYDANQFATGTHSGLNQFQSIHWRGEYSLTHWRYRCQLSTSQNRKMIKHTTTSCASGKAETRAMTLNNIQASYGAVVRTSRRFQYVSTYRNQFRKSDVTVVYKDGWFAGIMTPYPDTAPPTTSGHDGLKKVHSKWVNG